MRVAPRILAIAARRARGAATHRGRIAAVTATLAVVGGAIALGGSGSALGHSGGHGTEDSMAHMEMPTMAAYVPFAAALAPDGWTVQASSTAPGRSASAVIGSHPASFWQSASLGGNAHLPQSVTVRFPASTVVSGLTYVPHGMRGVIGHFAVRLSSDGRHFGAPVAYGTWQANLNLKRVGWVARAVRAVRLTVLSLSSPRDGAVAISRLLLAGPPHGQSHPARAGHRARAASGSSSASVIGQWGPTIGFPLVPVAVALIPGDRLIVWSADAELSYDSTDSSQYTQTAILNLATGVVSSATVSNTAHDMFCPGVSILPDGEVMVSGGIGDTDTSIYNPATNTWRAGPQLNVGRGYQGQTTLPDGQVFVLGGSWSGAQGGKLGEIWSPSGAWRELPNVPADPIYTNDAQGVFRADNHGWFIATSGGRILQAGPSEEMHWITTTGAGAITPAGPRGSSGDEMNGNAVLYDVNKVLAVGGAPSYQDSDATNVANVIDIGSQTPTVTPAASMAYARAFANSVVLPTGQVLTVGGQTYAVPFSDDTADLSPELWDPATGAWTVMAQEAEPRVYHSAAVLLPDGTVFSGGGGLCGTCATNHPDGQIFSPPYLFNPDGTLRARPTISSAPSAAQTGQTINVTTGGPVSSFVLMRYGESTHTVDNDQRRIPISITSQSGNSYGLSIPSDPGIVLPGPYMLFAIDANGTPSVSATIDITTPTTSTPPTAYGQRIDADGAALYWPLTDAAGSAGAADLSGNGDQGAFSSTGISYQTPSPVENPDGTGITLNGGQVVATEPAAAPATYSQEVWFDTTSTTGGLLSMFSGTGGQADRVLYMTSAGRLEFGVQTGTTHTIQSSSAYDDGKWHMAVATQGGDGMRLYVDGQLVASGSTATASSYTGQWQLGGTASGWPGLPASSFSGAVSDAAMFLSELAPSQVHAEYAAGLPPPPPPPPPPPGPVPLSVTLAGSGAGTVTGAGLSCPGRCDVSLASGTQATLTAAAQAGSTFAGWSGACTGAAGCTVTASQAQSLTATFIAIGSSPTSPTPPGTTAASSAAFSTVSRRTGGATVTLALQTSAAGSFAAHATFVQTLTVRRGRGAHRHAQVVHRTVTYATAHAATAGAGTTSLRLLPTAKALTLLRSLHRVRLTIVVTFVPLSGGASHSTQHATVSAPARASARQGGQLSAALARDLASWICGGAPSSSAALAATPLSLMAGMRMPSAHGG